jgi:hypothetical protein
MPDRSWIHIYRMDSNATLDVFMCGPYPIGMRIQRQWIKITTVSIRIVDVIFKLC